MFGFKPDEVDIDILDGPCACSVSVVGIMFKKNDACILKALTPDTSNDACIWGLECNH